MTVRILALAALLVTPLVARPQETTSRPSRPAENLMPVTYAVADLVVPIDYLDVPADGDQKGKTKEEWLIRMITRSVAPTTWENAGGPGTVQYHPLGMSLVVRQSPEVHARIRNLLETMRRVQNVEVAVEMRVVEVDNDFFLKKIRPHLSERTKDGDTLLNDLEVYALLEKAALQASVNVLQAPKVTVFPGQRVKVTFDDFDARLGTMVAGNLRHVDVDVKVNFGKARFETATRLLDGTTLALTTRKDKDATLMLLVTPRIILNVEENVLAGEAPKAAQPKPRVIQAGATDVVPAPIRVQPTYTAPQAAEAASVNTRLANVLRKYEKACQDGDRAQARRWALRALEIDPACFWKGYGY
jgi:hypothetical protein